MVILGIESSCDETAAAVLELPMKLLSSEVASQVNKHRPFGGVVPELASRNHLLSLRPVMESALKGAGICLDQVEAFAATAGPGLASSLLMGNTAAKAKPRNAKPAASDPFHGGEGPPSAAAGRRPTRRG